MFPIQQDDKMKNIDKCFILKLFDISSKNFLENHNLKIYFPFSN